MLKLIEVPPIVPGIEATDKASLPGALTMSTPFVPYEAGLYHLSELPEAKFSISGLETPNP